MSDRLENTFLALALTLSDAIRREAQATLRQGGETAAALTLIGHVPGLSIDQVAGGLGLSHPGTVRVVDRLVGAGYCRRVPSERDRRAVELRLTRNGRRMRRAILAGRRELALDVLEPLTSRERLALDAIVAKLLRARIRNEVDAYETCRLCDETACEPCPVVGGLAASGDTA